MSVTTFTDTMADIEVELNDREIYNDIRSATDITEQTEIQGDGTPSAFNEQVQNKAYYNIEPGQQLNVTFDVKSGHTSITWLKAWCSYAVPQSIFDLSQAECTGLGGRWYPPYDPSFPAYSHSVCYFSENIDEITVSIISQTQTSITLRVVNTNSLKSMATINVSYKYLAQQAFAGPVTIETERRTLTVRATDATSIGKYGRRVMNLTWPLGQTQEQMQSLVNSYLERYKEPAVMATMRIQGTTDALVVQILTRKISELITVENTLLNLSEDFYINSVDISHDAEGLLEAVWRLEQVRGMELASLFTLDTSLLDGPDVLGW